MFSLRKQRVRFVTAFKGTIINILKKFKKKYLKVLAIFTLDLIHALVTLASSYIHFSRDNVPISF
jgi:hypothetical protein